MIMGWAEENIIPAAIYVAVFVFFVQCAGYSGRIPNEFPFVRCDEMHRLMMSDILQ